MSENKVSPERSPIGRSSPLSPIGRSSPVGRGSSPATTRPGPLTQKKGNFQDLLDKEIARKASTDSVGRSGSKGKKGIQVKYVRGPRPQPPWEAAKQEDERKHVHHSRLHHFLAQLHVVESSSDSDEGEHEHHPREFVKPTKRYCVRIIFPGLVFTLGIIMLLVFIVNLINVLPRTQGLCQVTGFQRGRPCGDCKFEIRVKGLQKPGFLHLQFTENGKPSGNAFENCPKSDCCAYETKDLIAQASDFCDTSPFWDCHYILSNGETPTGITDGNLQSEYMVFLYLAIVFLVVLSPMCFFYACQLEKRYSLELDEQFEASKQVMRDAEAQKSKRGVGSSTSERSLPTS